MSGFVLHGSPHSIYTYKVALMLRLCGVGFSFRYVSFQRGMHLTSEFRAFSRWGQVPVLEHNGQVLLQSAAILEYLSETLGRFGACDGTARQEIREWLFWNADRLSPPLYGWYSIDLGRRGLLPLAFDPAIVARWERQGETALSVLNAHLASRSYLVGEAATIADICCYGEIAFAQLCGHNLVAWPRVVAWAERIEVLPGFAGPFDLLAMADVEIEPLSAE